MKKLIYVFALFATLTSCDSDNEAASDIDPIVGNWQLQSTIEDGDEIITECEKNTTIFFDANGTATVNSFYDEGNGCQSETDNATWVNAGNSTYKLDGEEAVAISFSANNTVFTVTTSESFNGMTYTMVITYKKI